MVASTILGAGAAAAGTVGVPGLPAGAAAAALRPEPSLAVPTGWTFPDSFSRTSGTGRTIGGAFEWTDWVYDDYGATDALAAPQNSIAENAGTLSPARGSYIYPPGPASNDGADIFRAAVGVTSSATVWRVDWNTLVDPSVPIAEWTFDTDNNARTGASGWAAAANVVSPGIERALVVSAKQTRLIDATTGATIAAYPTIVDTSARSFVVAVPLQVLPIGGRWRIRLGAGLADAAGMGFAVPTLNGGDQAGAGSPRIYNITFRTAAQEPAQYSPRSTAAAAQAADQVQKAPAVGPKGSGAAYNLLVSNFWGEGDQADTLAGGDVTRFSQLLDWRQLESRVRTDPTVVRGWSDRWYVTDLGLGQGVAGVANANPALLGRIQPYAVYLPTDYLTKRAYPLTWTLHSASVNYNQYPTVNPRLVQQVCEERQSVCASPEGFGANGLYQGIAEHDFWQVWRQVASSFKVVPDGTVVTGYSMGGLASFVLPSTYPSVFSESMPLDGGFDEGCTSAPTGAANFSIASASDRSPNVHWVPLVISDSYTDELSPYPNNAELVRRLEAAADQFTLFSTTTPEHITTDSADGFSTQVAVLHGTPKAKNNPGTIDYTWCANAVDDTLGLGPTSLYWLSGLAQRGTAANAVSRIAAVDFALPEPGTSEQVGASVANPPDAPPMQVLTGSWALTPSPGSSRTLRLTLTNVAALAIDTAAARLGHGTAVVTSDGATRLTLSRLAPGTIVRSAGQDFRADSLGTATVTLATGSTTISW